MTVERRWPDDVYVRTASSDGRRVFAQVACGDGRNIHVAGTLPLDTDHNVIGENDVRAQTEAVLEHIRRSLAAFGAGPGDVVRTKTYVIDMADYLKLGVPAWMNFFGDDPPASTTVGVTALADPRALVEIEAYAVIPE